MTLPLMSEVVEHPAKALVKPEKRQGSGWSRPDEQGQRSASETCEQREQERGGGGGAELCR